MTLTIFRDVIQMGNVLCHTWMCRNRSHSPFSRFQIRTLAGCRLSAAAALWSGAIRLLPSVCQAPKFRIRPSPNRPTFRRSHGRSLKSWHGIFTNWRVRLWIVWARTSRPAHFRLRVSSRLLRFRRRFARGWRATMSPSARRRSGCVHGSTDRHRACGRYR